MQSLATPLKIFQYHEGKEDAVVIQLADELLVEVDAEQTEQPDLGKHPEHWKLSFKSWEDWWTYFTASHSIEWIKIHPTYIHQNLRPYIQQQLDGYNYSINDMHYHMSKWYKKL